jgi:hypothetical protein
MSAFYSCSSRADALCAPRMHRSLTRVRLLFDRQLQNQENKLEWSMSSREDRTMRGNHLRDIMNPDDWSSFTRTDYDGDPMAARTLICAALVLLIAVGACSKSESTASSSSSSSSAADADASVATTRALSSRVGSCDRVAVASTCSEYSGGYLVKNEGFLTSSCQRLRGTFAYGECPNIAVIGGCTLSTGEVRRFYATGGATWDVDRAKTECEGSLRGTFKSL